MGENRFWCFVIVDILWEELFLFVVNYFCCLCAQTRITRRYCVSQFESKGPRRYMLALILKQQRLNNAFDFSKFASHNGSAVTRT